MTTPNPTRPRRFLVIAHTLCHHCGACVAVCPANALYLLDACLTVDAAACSDCENCVAVCPVQALALSQEGPPPEGSHGEGSPREPSSGEPAPGGKIATLLRPYRGWRWPGWLRRGTAGR